MPACKQGNQRWRGGRSVYRPPRETITPRHYEIAEESADGPVKRFIETHHYSGSYPAARFRYSLRRHGHRVGAAVFSVPMNPRSITNALPGAEAHEGVELGRFVLLDEVPGNGESWFLARCFEQLRGKGLRGVVSFSDPMPRRTAAGEVVFRGHLVQLQGVI